ncbi:TPA: DUF2493 domain-containing protein [Clostridium botulinum]|nr:DUF2493 domain-containing protein [Clostridium botulinum]HDK7206289.1 DUF2493 domain-containing protein [Clostridium botulinum]HDK7210025.1 DUF2493 domain-containing protein [Clostridium botulinum]HDK7265474.1 DUF2493 domain-containing protein [Clostridium botulinum]HDK7269322.1 DUF2493 domain-containing protein [Clostridium botulinum]
MKLAIIGGSDFANYDLLVNECDKIKNIDTIVSGGANGADTLGEKYAKEKGYKTLIFPAKWNDLNFTPCKIKYNRYGNPYNCLAGLNRNKDIINNADIVIAFWDGKSKGTKNSINITKRLSKELIITKY